MINCQNICYGNHMYMMESSPTKGLKITLLHVMRTSFSDGLCVKWWMIGLRTWKSDWKWKISCLYVGRAARNWGTMMFLLVLTVCIYNYWHYYWRKSWSALKICKKILGTWRISLGKQRARREEICGGLLDMPALHGLKSEEAEWPVDAWGVAEQMRLPCHWGFGMPTQDVRWPWHDP